MARPRIFISSTFYDLRQIRQDLDKFIEGMGYDSVMNEDGDIPYGKEDELQEYCYKEISSIDILVSIIGSRYGSESTSKQYSVSQKELKTALDAEKQVYIFIQKDVASEFQTYKDNKDNKDVVYHYVDNPEIYRFLEEIYSLPKNNNIKVFDSADDITCYLRDQWAGLFKKFIDDQQRSKEALVLRDIEGTVKTLHSLVDYLQSVNQDKNEAIGDILKTHHPLVLRLKSLLEIPYNFYIEGIVDLNDLLTARRFIRTEKDLYIWTKSNNKEIWTLTISNSLFDNNGKLKRMNVSEWNDEMCELAVSSIADNINDDLPF